jgi:hypothetical protein
MFANVVWFGFALELSACASNQFGAPCSIPENATTAQQKEALALCQDGFAQMPGSFNVRNNLDILFMIDNSPSMAPKQAALAANISAFMRTIDQLPNTDYHVGVVTSDVGSTTAPGMTWTDPTDTIGSCNTFAGDDGLLQITPCTQRTNGSSAAKNACTTALANLNSPNFNCSNFATTDGNRFISKTLGQTNVPVDMEPDPNNPGQSYDQGVIDSFTCIGLVGDGGCGIEGQLEGAKRALDGHLTENANFLSKDAYLAIIFITDEDDCSVQLSQRSQNNPITTTCQTPDQNADYSCYNFDYRCLARSIQCDQPMNQADGPGQMHTNCKERPDNYLNPVQQYHDTFLSYVQDPSKLIVSGIWTQPSIENGGQLIINYLGGEDTSPYLNRAPGQGASCIYTGTNTNYAGVFGQAESRLSEFANSYGTIADPANPQNMIAAAPEFSICDIDNYGNSLNYIAERILKKIGPFCLPVIPQTMNDEPVCLVGDVDATEPNAFPDPLLPVCSTTCCQGWASSASPTVLDPTVQAACAAEPNDCYCAVQSSAGACSPLGEVGGIWRAGGASPPAGKSSNFICAGTTSS